MGLELTLGTNKHISIRHEGEFIIMTQGCDVKGIIIQINCAMRTIRGKI